MMRKKRQSAVDKEVAPATSKQCYVCANMWFNSKCYISCPRKSPVQFRSPIPILFYSVLLYWDASFLHHVSFLLLSTIAAKKKRSAGRQGKDTVPESTNKSVFATFLREAGVTLRQGGTSNEIGKPLALGLNTRGDEIVTMLQNFSIFSYIFFLF